MKIILPKCSLRSPTVSPYSLRSLSRLYHSTSAYGLFCETTYGIIFLLMLIVFGFSGFVSAIAQDEHTVAIWLFEEGEGKVIKDISGNGNDGELKEPKWDKGKLGGGLKFGGKSNFVEVPDSESLDLTDELTIEMWLYLNAYSTAGGNGVTKETAYKVGTRSDKKAMIRMTTSELAWGSAVLAGKTDVPLNSWHHVAGTYDAKTGEAKVYLDGKEDGVSKIGGQIVPNDSVLWIGRGQGPHLDGFIDEVRISNIVRSAQEIQDAMERGIAGLFAVSSKSKLAITWSSIKVK